jgi:CheY-like chemotaxis protein
MNLCTNAAYAMRDKGGILRLGISRVILTEGDRASEPDITPGEYVVLEVRDTGRGMEPETLERVFDPFFTTKKQGEGTGLGLSVVHGIVKSFGGHITVESEPAKGTSFSIYLPKADERLCTVGKHTTPVAGGKERILLVDDEDIMIALDEERLTGLGYEVVASTSSEEALEIFRKTPDRFDLVITDYTMPNLTGIDLAAQLLMIKPTIPIVLWTGYNEAVSRERVQKAGIKAFLMKPSDKNTLAATIRRVLDGETDERRG